MKHHLLILILLIAFSCQNSAKKTRNQDSGKPGAAKFVFQEELHNFGSLQAGEVVAYTFQFENTGTERLIIENADGDCGCITIDYSPEPINPGETGYFEIIFNSAGEVGKVYKEIRIFSNAEIKEKKLVITANVQNELINIYSQN